MLAKDVMTDEVVTVPDDMPLAKIAALAATEATAGVKRVDDHLGIVSAMERVAHGSV
jgi:hypothetical protein